MLLIESMPYGYPVVLEFGLDYLAKILSGSARDQIGMHTFEIHAEDGVRHKLKDWLPRLDTLKIKAVSDKPQFEASYTVIWGSINGRVANNFKYTLAGPLSARLDGSLLEIAPDSENGSISYSVLDEQDGAVAAARLTNGEVAGKLGIGAVVNLQLANMISESSHATSVSSLFAKERSAVVGVHYDKIGPFYEPGIAFEMPTENQQRLLREYVPRRRADRDFGVYCDHRLIALCVLEEAFGIFDQEYYQDQLPMRVDSIEFLDAEMLHFNWQTGFEMQCDVRAVAEGNHYTIRAVVTGSVSANSNEIYFESKLQKLLMAKDPDELQRVPAPNIEGYETNRTIVTFPRGGNGRPGEFGRLGDAQLGGPQDALFAHGSSAAPRWRNPKIRVPSHVAVSKHRARSVEIKNGGDTTSRIQLRVFDVSVDDHERLVAFDPKTTAQQPLRVDDDRTGALKVTYSGTKRAAATARLITNHRIAEIDLTLYDEAVFDATRSLTIVSQFTDYTYPGGTMGPVGRAKDVIRVAHVNGGPATVQVRRPHPRNEFRVDQNGAFTVDSKSNRFPSTYNIPVEFYPPQMARPGHPLITETIELVSAEGRLIPVTLTGKIQRAYFHLTDAVLEKLYIARVVAEMKSDAFKEIVGQFPIKKGPDLPPGPTPPRWLVLRAPDVEPDRSTGLRTEHGDVFRGRAASGAGALGVVFGSPDSLFLDFGEGDGDLSLESFSELELGIQQLDRPAEFLALHRQRLLALHGSEVVEYEVFRGIGKIRERASRNVEQPATALFDTGSHLLLAGPEGWQLVSALPSEDGPALAPYRPDAPTPTAVTALPGGRFVAAGGDSLEIIAVSGDEIVTVARQDTPRRVRWLINCLGYVLAIGDHGVWQYPLTGGSLSNPRPIDDTGVTSLLELGSVLLLQSGKGRVTVLDKLAQEPRVVGELDGKARPEASMLCHARHRAAGDGLIVELGKDGRTLKLLTLRHDTADADSVRYAADEMRATLECRESAAQTL